MEVHAPRPNPSPKPNPSPNPNPNPSTSPSPNPHPHPKPSPSHNPEQVELLGRDSPGPGTATAKIASVGGQLEKTTAARKVPVFGFGKSTNERVQPRVQETAGPADTVCDRKVLEFTRLKRTPAASFASPTDTELFKSSSAASLHGLVGLLHPSRTPGPGTYVIKNQIEGNSGTTIRPEPQPSPQPEPQPEPEPQPQP